MASQAVSENELNSTNIDPYAEAHFLPDNSTTTESDLRARVVIILNSMNEEERRSVINVIKGRSIELDSDLVLNDKSNDEEVRVPAYFAWQLLQESWSEQCDRDHDPKIVSPNRVVPSSPPPETPRCFGKLSRKKKLVLILLVFAVVALISVGIVFAVLSFLRSEKDASLTSFNVTAHFESFIKTVSVCFHNCYDK